MLYSKIHADIIERLPEFQLAQDLPSYLMQPPSLVHWSPPPCLCFNANFDGAIFQDIAAPGLGVVIRDAETIIKSLNSDEVCLVPLGHLIEDSLQLISSFRSFAFSHVKRKGNCVADKLAKLAKGSPLSQIWLEDIHNDATNLVMFVRSFG